MNLADIIQQFLASRSLSVRPRTLEWYEYCLQPLAKALGQLDVSQLSTEHLEGFLAGQAVGRSPKTQESFYTALKTLFRWAIERGHLPGERNPMNGIRPPRRKRGRSIPEVYTDAHIRALLRAADNRRDRAILLVFLDCGLRRDELLQLNVEDVDFHEGFLKVLGKGGKEHFVPIQGKALAAIREMLLEYPNHGALWRNRWNQRLGIGGLRSMLLRLKERAGLECRVHPHKFRHTFARRYLEMGGDLQSLSEILGHTDIGITSRYYASFLRGSLKEKHRRHSPVERSAWDQNELW